MPAARKRPRSNTDTVYWLNLGYFGVGFKVAFVPTAKALATVTRALALPATDYPTNPASCLLFKTVTDKRIILVTVAPDQDTSNGIAVSSLILHEAVHVWQFLCEKIGEEKPSVEFEAYMVQNLYGDLAEAYCKTRRELFKIPFHSK